MDVKVDVNKLLFINDFISLVLVEFVVVVCVFCFVRGLKEAAGDDVSTTMMLI